MERLPAVLITIGDPSSSAPELAVKAALDPEVRRRCRPVVIGAPTIVEDALRRINANPQMEHIKELFLREYRAFDQKTLYVLPWGNLSPKEYDKGAPSALAGRHAVEISRTAARMALDGVVDAVCSAPTSKVSLHLAGYDYKGMSHVFLEVSGAKNYETMLVLNQIRMVLATSHVPFRSVPDSLDKSSIISLILILKEALINLFRIPKPRIGVAALNPHAGEGGLYGREELDILIPAIEVTKQQGVAVFGPIPADYVVPKIQSGNFDGAVMMYHDQANIPLKATGLYKPATLLLGLPIIRTSVAHGTVYGKAKSGTADPTGMIHSCVLAAHLGTRKS